MKIHLHLFVSIVILLQLIGCASTEPEDITIPIEMIYIEGGSFIMGDYYNEGDIDELPLHNVTLSSFYMSKHEVTQAQFESIMGYNPSYNKNENSPVETISFFKIIEFCNYKSIEEGLIPHYLIDGETNPDYWTYQVEYIGYTGYYKIVGLDFNWLANGYRLPTEAEWEYAARGGVYNSDSLRFSGCNDEEDLHNYAWFDNDSGIQIVGTKMPNQLGLYDMSGNVWEICWDGYSENYYYSSPEINPIGPDPESWLVIRGGSFYTSYFQCRVANRDSSFIEPNVLGQPQGFRIAQTINS